MGMKILRRCLGGLTEQLTSEIWRNWGSKPHRHLGKECSQQRTEQVQMPGGGNASDVMSLSVISLSASFIYILGPMVFFLLLICGLPCCWVFILLSSNSCFANCKFPSKCLFSWTSQSLKKGIFTVVHF